MLPSNRFDKAYYQDFRPGLETEYDELSIIGECANFDIGDILIAQHEGKLLIHYSTSFSVYKNYTVIIPNPSCK